VAPAMGPGANGAQPTAGPQNAPATANPPTQAPAQNGTSP
jgi:hypothetical protein